MLNLHGINVGNFNCIRNQVLPRVDGHNSLRCRSDILQKRTQSSLEKMKCLALVNLRRVCQIKKNLIYTESMLAVLTAVGIIFNFVHNHPPSDISTAIFTEPMSHPSSSPLAPRSQYPYTESIRDTRQDPTLYP